MTNDTYYGTKYVRFTGRAIAINIPKEWPFKKGDVVDFEVRRVSEDQTFSAQKAVRQSGTSLCVYCNKDWGMERDTMVVFSMRLTEHAKTAGRGIKNKDSGVSRI